ncbi:MAG TPA: thermonuclease family protein [Candidatus Saccharibacteria bacterium]|nr:micrococcal nuclease [Patescibacteria group bacterium]HMS31160.1 thermonuclease family protein [Candidatus Saccharibacteria bacterium]
MNKRQKRRLINILIALLTAVVVLLQQHGYLQQPAINTKQVIEQSTPGLYQVTKFDDGDTIQVDMEGKKETIRFIGVDTPETHDPRKPIQCFGKAAAAFTKNLIGENRVRLEADPTNSNRDRYQRLLRYVYLPNGTLVNKKIIAEGYGFALVSFPFQKMEEFKAVQVTAREQNKGLWGGCTVNTSTGYNQTNPE